MCSSPDRTTKFARRWSNGSRLRWTVRVRLPAPSPPAPSPAPSPSAASADITTRLIDACPPAAVRVATTPRPGFSPGDQYHLDPATSAASAASTTASGRVPSPAITGTRTDAGSSGSGYAPPRDSWAATISRTAATG